MIKLIHTSDWHLGKKLFKQSRKEEMDYFLKWLLKTIETKGIDILLISGDIFDTVSPSHDAIDFFYKALDTISKTNASIFVIAGNHDSGVFLNAPRPFLKNKDIHIVGHIQDFENQNSDYIFTYEKKGQKLELFLLPFFRSSEILKLGQNLLQNQMNKEELEDLLVNDTQKFVELTLKIIFSNTKEDCPRLLMAHHQFGSFSFTGSEIPVGVAGINSIPTSLVKDFDYVALGHIHKRQVISKDNPSILYSGSPIPFRFSEGNKKSVEILEVKDNKITHFPEKIEGIKYLHTLKLEADSFLAKANSFLKNNPKNGYLQLIILEGHLSSENLNWFIIECSKHEIEIINVQNQNSKIEILNKDLNDQTDIYDLNMLFEDFYKIKFPEEESIDKNLKEDFFSLIHNIEDSSDENIKTVD